MPYFHLVETQASKMKVLIESDRILLRKVMESDVDDFHELDSDPEVHRYLGNTPHTERAQSVKTVTDLLQQYKDNGIARLAIIDKNTKEFIGWSGLKLEKGLRPDREYIDIGYRLKRKHWGNGYATEAAKLSLKLGFEVLGYEEIGAAAEVEHIVSNHILSKIRMTQGEPFLYKEFTLNWYTIYKASYLKLYP